MSKNIPNLNFERPFLPKYVITDKMNNLKNIVDPANSSEVHNLINIKNIEESVEKIPQPTSKCSKDDKNKEKMLKFILESIWFQVLQGYTLGP